jgi:putative radical SAM enzyme (TIGR03279 family)
MHTQIVLCPGLNDGDALLKTVADLYEFHKRIVSLAIVPVGLTDHRFGLHALKKVDGEYAARLLDLADGWQRRFRKETGRGFVYPSDEFFIVAGRPIPPPAYYDGFPQTENGVGIVRSFLMEFSRQARRFPANLPLRRKLTMATAELPATFMKQDILPRLERIGALDVTLEVVPNSLYGRSVTVAGLLSGKCVYSALKGKDCGDMLLLPPDTLNATGVFLDDMTVEQLEGLLGVPVMVFDGRWSDVFAGLRNPPGKHKRESLLQKIH